MTLSTPHLPRPLTPHEDEAIRTVRCPRCSSEPGEGCRNLLAWATKQWWSTHRIHIPHRERIQALHPSEHVRKKVSP